MANSGSNPRETLHYTGCRTTELIEVTPARIDLSGGTITLRTLKKRSDDAGRPKIVPVPSDYDTAHGIREAQQTKKRAQMAL